MYRTLCFFLPTYQFKLTLCYPDTLFLFNNENMTGTIPMSLYNLTNLRQLLLYGNQFEGSIKPQIGNLKELTQFSIYSNQFTGTIPSELGDCEKLGMKECFGTHSATDNNASSPFFSPIFTRMVSIPRQ